VHQKVCYRCVQMDTDSPRYKVKEGAHFAVKQRSLCRFHCGESDRETFHSDCWYIGAR